MYISILNFYSVYYTHVSSLYESLCRNTVFNLVYYNHNDISHFASCEIKTIIIEKDLRLYSCQDKFVFSFNVYKLENKVSELFNASDHKI